MKVETAQEYRERVARAGGHGRARKLSAQERKDSAKKAAEARWARLKELADDIDAKTKALEKKARKKK